jgi:hypothetical protein
VRRLFWLSVGAAAGYYAARKGTVAVEQARERGLVGNVTLAASTASKVAATASRTTLAVGEAVGSRARALAEARSDDAAPAPSTAAPTTPGDGAPTMPNDSREVRP